MTLVEQIYCLEVEQPLLTGSRGCSAGQSLADSSPCSMPEPGVGTLLHTWIVKLADTG